MLAKNHNDDACCLIERGMLKFFASKLAPTGVCGESSGVHLPEFARLEVDKCLVNLLLGVHHERTVADDGLVDGFAAEQQHLGVVVGLQGQLLAVALEQRQLPLACDFFAIDQQRAAEHHQGGVTPGVQVQRDRFNRR